MGEEREGCRQDGRVTRLEAEVAELRLALEAQVRTREVVVVDDAGHPRIRLTTTAASCSADDGQQRPSCRLTLLDEDGFERVTLTARPDIGVVRVAGRSSGESSGVDLFALEGTEGDGVYVGLELIDRGNTVGGHTAFEGRAPKTWVVDP